MRRRMSGAALRRVMFWGVVGVLVVLLAGLAAVYFRSRSPGHLAAKAALALDQGDTDKAILYLQEALASKPEGVMGAKARNLLARAYIRAGREEDARAFINESLTQNPKDAEALELLLDSYVFPGFRKYQTALKPITLESAGDILKAIDEGRREITALQGRYPESPRLDVARGELNHLYYLVYDDQVAQAKGAVAAARDLVALERAKGWVAKLGAPYRERETEAIADLRQALHKDPKNDIAARLLAEYYLGDKEYDRALEVAYQMIERGALTEEVMIVAANAVLADAKALPATKERFGKAQQVLERYLAVQPKSPLVLVALGQVMLEKGEVTRAQELADKTLEVSPNDLDGLMLQANCKLRSRQPAEALRLVTPLTNTAANVPQVWQLLGQANSEAGNYQAADDAYRKALSLQPGMVTVRRGMLVNYLRAGNGEAAGRLADQLVREDRYFIPAWSVYADRLKQAGQEGKAREELGALAQDTTMPAEMRAELVRLLVAYGMNVEAGRVMGTLSGDPSQRESLLMLRASVLSATGKYAEAREVMAEAVAAEPGNVEVRLAYAEMLLRGNLAQDARGQLEEATKGAKGAEQLVRIAQGYLALQMPERAVGLAKRALELEPRNVRAATVVAQASNLTHGGATATMPGGAPLDPLLTNLTAEGQSTVADLVRLALVAAGQKNFQQALSLARSGLTREPNNGQLHLVAAQALHGLGQTDGAVNEIVLAVKQQPQDLVGYELLVFLYGNKADAGKGIEQAGKLAAYNSVYAGYAAGRLAAIAGQYERAIRNFNDALEEVGKVSNTLAAKEVLYNGLLGTYLAKGDEEAYRRTLDRVAGDEPFALMARLAAADRYLTLGQKTEARKQLEKLEAGRRVEELGVRAVLAIGQRWVGTGDAGHALGLIDRLTPEQKNTPEVHAFLADVAQQGGEFEKALVLRKKLVREEPANPTQVINLALLQAQMADYPGALTNLKACEGLGQTGAFMAAAARARLYTTLGLLEAAGAELEGLAKNTAAGDSQGALALGEAWAELRKPAPARKVLAGIPAYANEYVAAQVVLAELNAEEGKVGEAMAALRALEANSRGGVGSSAAALPLYQMLLRFDKAPEALELASTARQGMATGSRAWVSWTVLAAAAARDAGQWDKALEFLGTLRGMPEVPSSAMDMALLQLLAKRPAEAAAAAGAVSDAGPAYLQSTLRMLAAPEGELAGQLIKSQRIDWRQANGSVVLAALAGMEVSQWPDLVAGPLKDGRLFQGDLEALVKGLAGKPEGRRVMWHLALAQRLEESGWWAPALGVLGEAAKTEPEGYWGAVLRYQALVGLRRTDQAGSLREELLRKYPELPSVRVIAMQTLLAQRKYEEALGQLRPLVEQYPTRADVLAALGQLDEKMGRIDEAIQVHSKVRTLYPEDVSAANNLAYLLAQAHPQDAKTLAEAQRQIEWAASQTPDEMAVADTRGWIYVLQGEAGKGVEQLSKAIAALRLQPAAHYHLGMAYAGTGQTELARLHLENVGILAERREEVPEVKLAQEALRKLSGKEHAGMGALR